MPGELVNVISQRGFHFDSPNLQDSFNMALSSMVLHMGRIGQHLHAYIGYDYCEISLLTLWPNRDYILIHQTCRVAFICHYLAWYCKWATLIKIFMLVKDMCARWVRYHDKSTGFHFDSPNFQDRFNMALLQTVLNVGHIGQHLHAH